MPKPEITSTWRRQSYHALEEDAQSWEAQDVVTLDATTGKMRVAANADDKILGLGQADATGTEDEEAVATPLFPGDLINLDTIEVTGGTPKDVADFVEGNLYALYVDGNDEWFADFDNTADPDAITDALIFIQPAGKLADQLAGNTEYRGQFRIAEGVCLQHTGQ